VAKFDDWFNELEGFGLRSERFWEDAKQGHTPRMILWLKAAFEEGRVEGVGQSAGALAAKQRLAKLQTEYRPSMDGEVLHAWAKDVVEQLALL
jgi:hypothetical protein